MSRAGDSSELGSEAAPAVSIGSEEAPAVSIGSEEAPASGRQGSPSFPIVGVGASAGGMETFIELLQHVSPDTGMAFVLVQHLDRTHDSYLCDALARSIQLPVVEIRDGMRVEPDHVYVIPPNTEVGILKGVLVLFPRPTKRGLHLPIDFFFKALAADQGNQAIGVVLSGTGSDGAEGLRAIKAEDGVALAQDPASAKFSGMPEAAIGTGLVDFVLPVAALSQELLRIGRHPFVRSRSSDHQASVADDGALNKALVLLRGAVGVDFSEYKRASIQRRMARRMAVHRVSTSEEYLRILRENGNEAQALFEDILIHVTSFFRNPEVFATLKRSVFPRLLEQKSPGDTIRIWSVGCSTGEEGYSLVIALREFLTEAKADDIRVQLFGSDISELAIKKARNAVYPVGIARDVGAQRLAAFFTPADGQGYRINKSIREQCAFVKHNLVSDPPFSKLDLVSCRNLLIYFGPELQKRALATFQFALNRPGFLLLGNAESIADGSQLFSVVDKEHKIFARSVASSTLKLSSRREPQPLLVPSAEPRAPTVSLPSFVRRTESMLLERYVPPGVIVNERMEILHFLGRTGPYLEPAAGQPQHDLLKMARKGLSADLRIAISQAKKEKDTVRKSAQVEQDGVTRRFELVVITISTPPDSGEHLFAVLFDEKAPTHRDIEEPGTALPRTAEQGVQDPRVAQLEAELETNKEHLRAIVAEQQGTNEELLSANEELMSSNEELQSLNEEIETAKEELQSTNEELSTLNEELHTRNGELNSLNSDLINILGSVEVPIVIVDQRRLIRRFTPKARTILNLLATDIGRPIDDIKPTLAIENLDRKIAEVIDTVKMHEEEVQARDGRWHRLQIRPYLTVEKRIDGAVVSIFDIDVLKRAVGAAEWARDYARATVEAVYTPLLVLDGKGTILSTNAALRDQYGLTEAAASNQSLYKVLGHAFDVSELRAALAEVLAGQEGFGKLEVEREIPALGPRALSLSGRAVPLPGGERAVLLAVEDITERRQREAERTRLLSDTEAAKATAEDANRTKDQFLATLSHELRTPLSSLLLQAQLLRRGAMSGERLEKACDAIERATRAQAQLIDDLLDISRIVTGKLKMELRRVRLAAVVKSAVDALLPAAEKKKIRVSLEVDDSLASVSGDPARLEQVLLNLLTNAIKFTPDQGQVRVIVDSFEGRGRVRVSDTGIGIEPQFLPHIFSRFSQESRGQSRTHGGLGLGLAIVRYIVEAHGGTVEAASAGKTMGSQFTVLLPLMSGQRDAPSSVPAARPPGEPAVASIAGVRVLIVEDDQGTREALSEMLDACGAQVGAAQSAAEAMQLFESFKPDLLVSDLAMPDEDGYQLLARIRALGAARGGDVPALALTALASEEDRQSTLRAGFQEHLAKPVDIDRLLAVLSRLVKHEPSSTPAGSQAKDG